MTDFNRGRGDSEITPEDIDSLRGIGWEGDLEEMRRGTDPEHKWRSALDTWYGRDCGESGRSYGCECI